jgi:hypothetical protein
MKRSAKADSVDGPTGATVGTPAKHSIGKPSAKSARKGKNFTSPGKEKRLHAMKKSHRGPRIRETEEARSLLEKQLHSLYWWVFNASKIKGFVRAKALGELQRPGNDNSTNAEEHNLDKHIP